MGEHHIFSDWFLYDQGSDHEEEAEPDDGSDESTDEPDSAIDPSRVRHNANEAPNHSVPDGR